MFHMVMLYGVAACNYKPDFCYELIINRNMFASQYRLAGRLCSAFFYGMDVLISHFIIFLQEIEKLRNLMQGEARGTLLVQTMIVIVLVYFSLAKFVYVVVWNGLNSVTLAYRSDRWP